MDLLPQDYHDCKVQDIAYYLWNYVSISKVLERVNDDVIIYEITCRSGKQNYITTVKYNIPTQTYDVAGKKERNNAIETYGKRFISYRDVLNYLWELRSL